MRNRGTMETVPENEVNIDTVYVRTNIIKVEEEDFSGWEYDEAEYSLREYISIINELGRVLTDRELDNLILGQQVTELELRLIELEVK